MQLRNSRAALVADRRVWLLERRDREIAALAREPSGGMPPEEPSQRGAGGGMMRRGQAVGDLLEGLRPECEAVMRALFCRVDRCVIPLSWGEARRTDSIQNGVRYYSTWDIAVARCSVLWRSSARFTMLADGVKGLFLYF